MIQKLLILGAGQYGRVVKETAEAIRSFETISFLDDNSPIAVGKLIAYSNLREEYSHAFVAMGNPKLRMQWICKLKESGYDLPVLVHPKAYASPSAMLKEGTMVEPMAVINSEAIVECGCLICAGSVINHNAHVMPVCQIDCNAVVASNAVVPEGTKVFSGTVYERK